MDQYNNAGTGLENVGHDYNQSLVDNISPVSDKTDNKPEEPPAIRIKLDGKYLIEASAGTGKTWTLTGIVLRLLIEAKRAPEHIIATTFTRAAAAEMRQRIHDRLVDFYQLLQWLNNVQANPNTHYILYPQLINSRNEKSTVAQTEKSPLDKPDRASLDKKVSAEQKLARKGWLEEKAKLSGNADLLADPINSYLLTYLLDHTEDYPLADAIRRCALVLTTLDKLFVGTLDSLSQKWLAEYSAETGHQQGIQISDYEQTVIESILHDAVRAHHSHLYYQKPEIYQLLQHTNRLTTPVDHIDVAKKSIQFISTPIEQVEMGDEIDFIAYQQALDAFKQCDLTDIEPYFDKDYRKAQGFNARASIGTRADKILNIRSAVQQYGNAFFANLDEETQKFYEAVPHVFLSKEEGGKGFNAGKETERLAFINLESIQALKAIQEQASQIERYLDVLIENLNRDIALKVRQKLPSILEARRETTFALQMVRLNQALSGKQGERLTRYIRHHYPVALIDESQDINGEQARMIERIYLSKKANTTGNNEDSANQNRSRGFLLLVGDPKQAIYGFRGGDVANYNAMKSMFDKSKVMTLDVNRRSNARLITALNHWFGRPSPVLESQDANMDSASQLAQLGKQIYYQHITAAKPKSGLSWQAGVEEQTEDASSSMAILSDSPVSVIHLPYDKQAKYSAFELTALHIAALLASQQTIEGRPIKPNDIGVLGRRKHELKQVEDMLSKLGVPTLETAEKNVFDTPIAADLAALLEAMLKPHRRDIINRVLTSNFYQLSLDEVQASMSNEDEDNTDEIVIDAEQAGLRQRYQDFQLYLKIATSHWQRNGILSALHYLFGRNPMIRQDAQSRDKQAKSPNVWVGLADLEDGARYLMDLRHLLDILAQHGMHIGEHELLAWYKKNMNSSRTPEWAQQQPLPTESGVQLMTIHKSKGLEFPIVYVVGMDGASPKAGGRSNHNLFLYDHDVEDDKTERRLSASKGKQSHSAKGEAPTEYYAQFETIENYEELRRLGYVAFTRASEQLYMVLKDSYNKTDAERKPSLQWLSCEEHKFVLPHRLHSYVGWLAYATIEPIAEGLINTSKTPKNATTAKSTPAADTTRRIDYQSAYAQIQLNSFQGWAKTSFTALSRQLSEQSQALAIFDDGIEDDLDLTDGMNLSSKFVGENDDKSQDSQHELDSDNSHSITSDDIRFRFVKGANAGTFLHEIFEKINFTERSKWSAIIDQSIRQSQLPISYTSVVYQQRLQQDKAMSSDPISNTSQGDIESVEASQLGTDHEALIAWVADVLAAPLLASGQPLQDISPRQRIAELGFNMGLSEDFTPEQINDVFSQYLPHEPEKHIELTAQYASHIYRYLRGEIDLVYECAGKYYVVDYKSNYLGNSLSNYNDINLSAAMSKAGYWLQAAIYQVALHRFLRLRLKNYEGNEAQYLGAVEYVFLRGIDSKGTQNYGRIKWEIPFELVIALDEMFGSPSI